MTETAPAVFDAPARTWVVRRCPYCDRTHRHRRVPAAADPRHHLGWQRARCNPARGYFLEDA